MPFLVVAVMFAGPLLLVAAGLFTEWEDRMAMNERCRDCNRPADFRCESREVGERRKVTVGGQEKTIQPYLTFFLCAGCSAQAVAGDDPPRAVKALPHHQAAQARAHRDAQQALVGGGGV